MTAEGVTHADDIMREPSGGAMGLQPLPPYMNFKKTQSL